jgi:predicted nicotinamide N-methyase
MTPAHLRLLLPEHAVLRAPALCPEITAYEAKELVPLWEAAESLAGGEVEPPFWAFSWPGGQALARYLLDRPETVRGKSVLDLGCGNALAAIAAARAGAASVLANDIDPAAIEMARENTLENGASAVHFSLGDLLGSPPPGVDVVCAGDLFYERGLASRAGPWLRAAAAAGALVLAGDPGRAYTPRHGVESLAAYDVPVSLDVERESPLRTAVLRILP